MSDTDLSMQGKVCLVTGGTSGLGRATAFALARLGAVVVVVGRSSERCGVTVQQIWLETGNKTAISLVADLTSQADIRSLANEFQRRYPRLDVLVNNAGAYFMRRQLSVDGYELTFALNHLSYFLLTHLLLDRLKSTATENGEARVVNVSSGAHFGSKIEFDDLGLEHHYGLFGWRAYGQSKLANVLFTFELARRLGGSGVTSNCVHPGFVGTYLARNNGWLVKQVMRVAGRLGRTPEEGARTQVYLASSPEVKGMTGLYFHDLRPERADPAAYDEQAAQRLWQVSAAMTEIES